jgi:nitrile hydratase subunit beta
VNGPHDLGGQMGFGPVAPEKDEPLFHAPWEARAMAITLACGAFGAWTIDESRHQRECIPPARYLSASYYEIWITALEALLERHGFVDADERAAADMLRPGATPRRVLKAADVPAVLARGAPYNRPIAAGALFQPGDRVRTLEMNPEGHTRLPRYARDKSGIVESVHDGFVFPDTIAHGGGDQPQRLYTVRFTAQELWGAAADATLSVSIDAFEGYLVAA